MAGGWLDRLKGKGAAAAAPTGSQQAQQPKGKKKEKGKGLDSKAYTPDKITSLSPEDRAQLVRLLDEILAKKRQLSAPIRDRLAQIVIYFRNEKGVFLPLQASAGKDEIFVKISEIYRTYPIISAAVEQRYLPNALTVYKAGHPPEAGTPVDEDFGRFLDAATDGLVDEGKTGVRIGRNDVNSLVLGIMSGRLPAPKQNSHTAVALQRYVNIPSIRDLFSRLLAQKFSKQGPVDRDFTDFISGIARGAQAGSIEEILAQAAKNGVPTPTSFALKWNPFDRARTTNPSELAPYSDVFERLLRSENWHDHLRSGLTTVLSGLYAQYGAVPKQFSIKDIPLDANDIPGSYVRMFLAKTFNKADHAIKGIAQDTKKSLSQRNRELRMYANALWSFASYGLCTITESNGVFTFAVSPDAKSKMAYHIAHVMSADPGAQTREYFEKLKQQGVKKPDSVIRLVANRFAIFGNKIPKTPEDILNLYAKKEKKVKKKAAKAKPERVKTPETALKKMSNIELQMMSFVGSIVATASGRRGLKKGDKDYDKRAKKAPNPQTLRQAREFADRIVALKADTKDATNPFADASLKGRADNVAAASQWLTSLIGTTAQPNDTGFERLVALDAASFDKWKAYLDGVRKQLYPPQAKPDKK